MNINAAYYSSIGMREDNEDAVSILESNNSVLAIVADGLGGHQDGEIASKTAIKSINAQISHDIVDEKKLCDAIQLANDEIIKLNQQRQMRTTIACLWFNRDRGLIATLGDTRVYHFRNGKIIFQSIDHSAIQFSVLNGEVPKESIRTSKERNILTKALGVREEVKADVVNIDIFPGDAFILCSDGFWESVLENDMEISLRRTATANEWLADMKHLVENNESPTKDNHSAIAIRVEG